MKHTPDEKLLEEQLNNLQPSPSPRFYRRMRRAAWTPLARARRRAYAVTGLTLMLAAALLVFTPQGRAWAQEIIHYFTRAEGDGVPVTPISGTTTPDPGYIFDQAVAEVEQRAGFDILQPTWLPVDTNGQPILSFQGASYEPEHSIIRVFYRYTQGGEDLTDGLVLREERFQIADACELCGLVGASAAVETVQIGDVTGEYVEGVWEADDSGEWKWAPDPYVKTLRWQKGDLALEIQYFGLEVGKTDLIAIAESIMK